MRSSRRRAIKQFVTLISASALAGYVPVSKAQQASEPSNEQYLSDPLLQPVCVKDFEPLAKTKLDPLAYDYLVGGSEDEVSLRDNRSGFDRIIIRPKVLVDVHICDYFSDNRLKADALCRSLGSRFSGDEALERWHYARIDEKPGL